MAEHDEVLAGTGLRASYTRARKRALYQPQLPAQLRAAVRVLLRAVS